LGGDDDERLRQVVGLPVDGDLPLAHRLQQRGLCLRRCTVYLVCQHHVRKHRTGRELELAVGLVVDVRPGDIGREQVGCELYPRELEIQHPCERAGCECLSRAGDILEQHVSAGEYTCECCLQKRTVGDDGFLECGEYVCRQLTGPLVFHTRSLPVRI
jgi:hypothetical protein